MSADLATHREESATIARAESLSELLAGLRGDLVTLEEYAYTRLKEANSNLVELQAKYRVASSRNVFLKDWVSFRIDSYEV
ncbi:MAG: hypothetical protein KVP17_003034 [Porospora cf. gigantea B]|uniref:uncharacterized protein n=1 Tax=Porospora cf. gigantea B TaxID=2853592 RepID=UPI003571AB62|nr:MAG: hypothetical protein KVP17_003034 [Porospora cf. gigantea B]